MLHVKIEFSQKRRRGEINTLKLLSDAYDIFAAVWHQLTAAGANRGDLRLHRIEAVDTILVATVLFVIAAGPYQWFVHPALNLPP